MFKPEKFGHLHLVYHFKIPLKRAYVWDLSCFSRPLPLVPNWLDVYWEKKLENYKEYVN